MPIVVNFRVVGIFYQVDQFTVTTPNPCVEDVMKELVAADPTGEKFAYYKSTPDETLKAAAVTKPKPFTSKSGQSYPAGYYYLEDDLGINPYRTWQYYIVKKNGGTINSDNKFIPFGTPVSDGGYLVEDGDSVIWRCASILSGPAVLIDRAKTRLAALDKSAPVVDAQKK